MIPILFNAAETSFTTNGVGRLAECISCTVTEERNGVYECEFQYPITGRRYGDIIEGMYIFATHDDTKVPQPFEIYGRTAPINGVVTFYARHISYKLNYVVVNPFTGQNASDTMANIVPNSINDNPFTFWTDKTTVANFSLDAPSSVRGMLGGAKGSVLDVYGGEYEFDKWTVKLHSARGTNTDVTIRYGKNLTDLQQEIDNGETYDAVVPYWKQEDNIVMLDERVVEGSNGRKRLATLDLTNEFQNAPTKAQLKSKAQSRLNTGKPWIPSENIKINFIALWQTTQYKDVAVLQRVKLCDTVNVYYPALGVVAEGVKVIKAKYNVLLDRYDSMELGDARSSFAETVIKKAQEGFGEATKNLVTTSAMQKAIDYATRMITGGLGGYKVDVLNADGEPQETLWMDTDDIATAVNVIRINKNGIGFSTNGYNGPYTTAWTIDGHFNADFITTGNLDASLITTGALNADLITTGTMLADRIRAGLLTDATGKNYWNLTTGAMAFSGGFELVSGDMSTKIQKITYEIWYGYRGNVVKETKTNVYGLCIRPTNAGYTDYIALSPQAGYPDFVIHGGYPRRCMTGDAGPGYSWSESVIYDTHTGSYYAYLINTSTGKPEARMTVSKANVSLWGGDSTTDDASVGFVLSDTTFRIMGAGSALYDNYYGELYWDGNKLAYASSSSRRYKESIANELDAELDPHKLYDLQVKQFRYKEGAALQYEDMKDKTIIGFIAEEVNEVYPSAVIHNHDGTVESWDERRIVPPMLKLIQEQKAKIDELEERIARLEALVNAMHEN